MRRASAAQRILAIATTPDRAAAVVGDLLEEEPTRGRRWFWLTVARTTIAFAWLDVVRFVTGRHPAFSAAADSMGEIMDVWRFVWSRKRLVVIPVVLFTATASLVAYSRPVRYRSEALIKVVPQRVPESFVRSTVTTRVEDRLLSISLIVLSRTQLEPIIQEHNLYAQERRGGAIMQDVVERMRAVDIQTRVERGDTFRVSYVGNNPLVVRNVTEKIASLIISENVASRGNLAEGTSQFLQSSLEEARQNLKEQEERMAEFRRKYSAELPSQMELNIQRQGSVEAQIQRLAEALNDDRDRRLALERATADLEQELEDVPVSQPTVTAPEPSSLAQRLIEARKVLAALEKALAALEKEYPSGNRGVRRMKTEVQDLEEELRAEPETPGARPDRAAPATSPNEVALQRRLYGLRSDLERIDRKIAENEREQQRLRTVAATYQKRVEAVPSRETELAELSRGYQALQLIFETRFKNLEDAKTAANLERRQIGEQFQLLEPASLPISPEGPDRLRMSLSGAAAGFGLGLLLLLASSIRRPMPPPAVAVPEN